MRGRLPPPIPGLLGRRPAGSPLSAPSGARAWEPKEPKPRRTLGQGRSSKADTKCKRLTPSLRKQLLEAPRKDKRSLFLGFYL